MIIAALIVLAAKGNPVNLEKKIGTEIVHNLETDRGVFENMSAMRGPHFK